MLFITRRKSFFALVPLLALFSLAGCSNPQGETQASSTGLTFDKPYVFTQPISAVSSRLDANVPFEQHFNKYVFDSNGTCNFFVRTRKFWMDSSKTDDEGEWVIQLENAPYQVKGNSISVDWSQCNAGTKCAELGGDNSSEIVDIVSSGYKLTKEVEGGTLEYVLDSSAK